MEKAFDALNEMARFSLYEGYTWDNLETNSKINSDVEHIDSKDDNEENLGKSLLILIYSQITLII